MSRLGHIIYREWHTRVRRKAFILGTLLVPILIAGLVGLIAWLDQSEMEYHKVLVIDEAGIITFQNDSVNARLPWCPRCFPQREHLAYRFTNEALSDQAFLESEYTAMVFFDDGILQHNKAKFIFDKTPSLRTKASVESDLSAAIERLKVQEELELDYQTYQRLKTKISLVDEDVVTKDGNAFGRSIIGFVFSLFMFIQILVYGMHVMRGVIEEKSNRIVEIIISVVKPVELMSGKIIGIGLVGVTQVLALTLLGFLIFQIGGLSLEWSGVLTSGTNAELELDFETWIAQSSSVGFLFDVNWPLMIGTALIYFIAGFFMYASLFAAIGSAVDQESDAQYLMLPAMLPLLAAYLMAGMAMENPEGDLAVIGSYIPFTAPILMLIRLPLGVQWWELVFSMLGVILTAYVMVRISAKVFQTGILMQGKKATFKELFRWLRYR